MRKNIILLDGTVGYKEKLVDNIDTKYNKIIPVNNNPFEQFIEILNYKNITNIHIISHGLSGKILLGNTIIDKKFLIKNFNKFNGIKQNKIQPSKSIILYGCNIGINKKFIKLLSDITGFNIVATSNKFGYSNISDWKFNVCSHFFIDSLFSSCNYFYEGYLSGATYFRNTGTNVNISTSSSYIIFDDFNVTYIPTSATLIIHAYDVDYGLKDEYGNAYPVGNDNSEWDGVYIQKPNDLTWHFVDYLIGANGIWSFTSFDVSSFITNIGNYKVCIVPNDNGSQTRTINSIQYWVVKSDYVHLILDNGNSSATLTSLSINGNSVSVIANTQISGSYITQFNLINSNNIVVASCTTNDSLSSNVPTNLFGTLLPNSNFYGAFGLIPNGNYTLKSFIIDSSTYQTIAITSIQYTLGEISQPTQQFNKEIIVEIFKTKLFIGEKYQLNPMSYGRIKLINPFYYSSNNEVAIIDLNGVIHAKNKGFFYFIVMTNDYSQIYRSPILFEVI